MTNKQESYILPECCQHCVEADGFLGAKGCSNRTCECHKESHEGVEEEAVKNGYMGEFLGYYKPVDVEEILQEFDIHYSANWRWVKERINSPSAVDWLRSKLTPLVAQNTDKPLLEIVESSTGSISVNGKEYVPYVEQKEQKEGVEENYCPHSILEDCICAPTPTPTAK